MHYHGTPSRAKIVVKMVTEVYKLFPVNMAQTILFLALALVTFQGVVSVPNASQFEQMAMSIWLPQKYLGGNEIFGEYAWFRRELAVQPEIEQAVCT